MDTKEIAKVSEAGPKQPRTRHWPRVLLVVLLTSTVLVGLGIWNATIPDSTSGRITKRFHTMPVAIQMAVSISRPQDGLLFGEWIRARFAKWCPHYAPASKMIFEALDEPYGWAVYSNLPEGTKIKGSCPQDVVLQYLAIVRHDNGEIARIHPDGEGSFVIAGDGRPLLPVVPNGVALLDQFERGDAP